MNEGSPVATAAPARPPAAPILSDRGFFGHPRGLSTLFFTEMWERFSYYGMRALLILFMTAPVAAGVLGFDFCAHRPRGAACDSTYRTRVRTGMPVAPFGQ